MAAMVSAHIEPMNHLFLMCGLPFSGKTTAVLQIAHHRQAALISLEEMNAQRGLGFGGDGQISQAEWEKTHQMALSRAEELMETGTDIVIDDTNCFRFLRDNYRNIGDRHSYRTVVIQMIVSREEIHARMLLNEKSGERHGVKEHVLADLAQNFQWPGPDEEAIPFTSAQQITAL